MSPEILPVVGSLYHLPKVAVGESRGWVRNLSESLDFPTSRQSRSCKEGEIDTRQKLRFKSGQAREPEEIP